MTATLNRLPERYANGPYPEKADPQEFAIDRRLRNLAARYLFNLGPRDRTPERFVAAVDAWSGPLEALDETALQQAVAQIGRRLRRSGFAWDLVVESFALIRETSRRVMGKRHYGVQLQGAFALIRGHIAEMSTGEGKTLTATLAAATAALSGAPVHVVTVNDYLAARDAEEMQPLYNALGLSVGVVNSELSNDQKRQAYAADITYCTNKDLGFDYLRDRLQLKEWLSVSRLNLLRWLRGDTPASKLLMRGLCFAIVDEADSVLIDEARTPLIISGPGKGYVGEAAFQAAIAVAQTLQQDDDYWLNSKTRSSYLKPAGSAKAKLQREASGLPAPLESVWLDLVNQALTALYLYQKDRHYLVKDDKVQIVDEYTGRLMPDRSWEYGLHQLIEVKENCPLSPQKITLSRITYQRYFCRYLHLSGMTGTGKEVQAEFWSVYGLKTSKIPTHRPVQRLLYPPRLYRNQTEKWRAVVEAARLQVCERGRPVLIGTVSVEASEILSQLLSEAGLPHKVLNARQDAEEAETVAAAGQAGSLMVATNMAGRGTDIKLGPGVGDLGGLHVILTAYAESSRIDRQLYGRAGRQGDPGSAQAIVAMDDDLFEQYLPAGWGPLLALGLVNPIWVRLLTHFAQSRAERRNARIREQTLVSDRQIDTMLAFAGKEGA